MTEHTSLPWKIDRGYADYLVIADKATGREITSIKLDEHGAKPTALQEANARLIVTACNNYEQALEALKHIADYENIYNDGRYTGGDAYDMQAIADKAVRKAEDHPECFKELSPSKEPYCSLVRWLHNNISLGDITLEQQSKGADKMCFNGYRVKLAGKTEIAYDGIFHEAVYLEGPKKGESCWIADCLIDIDEWQDLPTAKVINTDLLEACKAAAMRMEFGDDTDNPTYKKLEQAIRKAEQHQCTR